MWNVAKQMFLKICKAKQIDLIPFNNSISLNWQHAIIILWCWCSAHLTIWHFRMISDDGSNNLTILIWLNMAQLFLLCSMWNSLPNILASLFMIVQTFHHKCNHLGCSSSHPSICTQFQTQPFDHSSWVWSVTCRSSSFSWPQASLTKIQRLTRFCCPSLG